MGKIEVFLRWDGVYIPDGDHKHANAPKLWRNSELLGACKGARAPDRGERRRAAIQPGFKPTTGATLQPPRPVVEILETSPRFAPGEEWSWIRASIENITNVRSLVLQVRDREGTLVYTERLSRPQVWSLPTTLPSGAPPLRRRADESPDTAATRARLRWARPGGSPYTFTILTTGGVKIDIPSRILGTPDLVAECGPHTHIPDADASTSARPELAQTHVVASTLRIEPMAWSELYELSTGVSARFPPRAPSVARTRWVQYKLNELGWFAGPIDGNDRGDDLRRAIQRYRQSHGKLAVRMFVERPGNGHVFELSGDEPSDAIDDGLVAHLRDNARPRTVVSDPQVFGDATTEARILVDAERFCIGTIGRSDLKDAALAALSNEFADDTGEAATRKSLEERAWLSSPRLPLRAKVEVLNQAGDPVWSPAVSHSLRVRWRWQDRAQNTESLPSDESAATPSTTKQYVERATVALADAVASRFHNARELVGGQIVADDDANAAVVFDAVDGRTAPADAGWGATSIGDTIYFCPSLIAGDAYQITAAIDGHEATTGWMTLWRRIHVRAHFGWGEQPSDAWGDVAQKYAHAYVEIVPPAVRLTMREAAEAKASLRGRLAAELRAGAAQGQQNYAAWDLRPHACAAPFDAELMLEALHRRLEAILSEGDDAYTQWRDEAREGVNVDAQHSKASALLRDWRNGRDDAVFASTSTSTPATEFLLTWAERHYAGEFARIFMMVKPQPPGHLNVFQASMWGLKEGNKPHHAFRPLAEPRRLEMCPEPTPEDFEKDQRKRVDDAVYDEINRTRGLVHLALEDATGPGLVVLEFKPHPEIDGWMSQKPENISMGGAKVLINRACFGPYDPVHLFAHEVAHALFLKHYKNAPQYVEADHDGSDENCVMSYIYGGAGDDKIVAEAHHYHRGNYRPEFCGKCNLKLRGWNIRAAAVPAAAR